MVFVCGSFVVAIASGCLLCCLAMWLCGLFGLGLVLLGFLILVVRGDFPLLVWFRADFYGRLLSCFGGGWPLVFLLGVYGCRFRLFSGVRLICGT